MTKTILLIDDDHFVLRTLTKCLKGCGYTVVTAASGEEALEKSGVSKFDLIISDIRMPQMNGIETLKRIRQQPNNDGKFTPAIIITGYAGEKTYRADEALGIVGYLYKPFELDEFVTLVKRHIEPIPVYERAASRIAVTFPLRLTWKESQFHSPSEIIGQTLTISEDGLSITVDQEVPLNSEVKVYLDPLEGYPPIHADARIVWSEIQGREKKHCYGLHFSKLEKDGIYTLREIINKYKSLSGQFVSLTKQLHQFVQKVKDTFDSFDKEHSDEQERINFLKARRDETFKKLTEYFDQIWDIVKDFDRDRYVIHKDYYQRTLGVLLLDPIVTNRRIHQKPLGYPGDYIIMNYIYNYHGDKAYLGNSTYEKLINHYTCNLPVSCSNIARKDFLKNMITEVINDNKISHPKIISIGCGSARELIELLNEGRFNKPSLFSCLDLEIEALKYIQNAIETIPFEKAQYSSIRYIHKDLINIIRDRNLKDEIKGHNLIYLSGIYDYLTDRMAERLIKELYSLLAREGKLIVCNISSSKINSKYRAYYEPLGEWCMVHRNEKEMLRWTDNLPKVSSEFVYPSNGSGYNFLIIKKIK